MKNLVVTICLVGLSAIPAAASGCSNQDKHFDVIAKKLPDKTSRKRVLALIALAKTEHDKGNHAASMAYNEEVDRLLGM